MDKKERLKIHMENYYHELNRKDNLRTRLIIPSTAIFIFIAITIYIFKNCQVESVGLTALLFWLFALAFIGFLGITFFYLIKAWKGYKYAYLPKSTDLEQYFENLSDYQEENYVPQDYTEKKYYGYLISQISKNNSQNFENNQKLSDLIYKIQTNLSKALLLAIISLLILYSKEIWTYSENVLSILF